MINVNGVILIVSCEKYKEIRRKYKLDKNNYNGWEVVYLFGDENLDTEYKYNDNILKIKCEDSYLFLMKKLILGMKYINEIFNIKEGILRCGDDLIFKEKLLIEFLNTNKNDYIGKNFSRKSIIGKQIDLTNSIHNNFMCNYYDKNNKELIEINKQIKKYNENLDIYKINKTIDISEYIALGHIYYLSINSVNILINEFNNINNNILHFENDCYPYILEDVGIGYILFKNDINLEYKNDLWFNPHYQNFDKSGEYLCFHTNEGND
jgi:hypothetical protein